MPVKKRATTPPQFAELLQCFPCPAWIETPSGKILARNAHPLPPAHGMKTPRLVALFRAGQKPNWRRRPISSFLAKALHPKQAAAADKTRLTPREREIYSELSRGCSYKTIAENLGISHATVRWHIARMRQKLGDQHIPVLRQKNSEPPQPKPT